MRQRKENRLSTEKVVDYVRMSDRLGLVEKRIVGYVGLKKGTLHEKHRGGLEHDVRYECMRRV